MATDEFRPASPGGDEGEAVERLREHPVHYWNCARLVPLDRDSKGAPCNCSATEDVERLLAAVSRLTGERDAARDLAFRAAFPLDYIYGVVSARDRRVAREQFEARPPLDSLVTWRRPASPGGTDG